MDAEQLVHGAETAHKWADRAHGALDFAHEHLGVGGEAMGGVLKHAGAFLAPVGIGLGAGHLVHGARKGGGEGANEVIEGLEGVSDGVAGLPGVSGTPWGMGLKVFSGGLKVGHWLDEKLGISDGISDATSGIKAKERSLGLVKQDVRGVAGIEGAEKRLLQENPYAWINNKMQNATYVASMRAKGLEWDPAAGNWMPKKADAAAQPFQHLAD